MSYSIDELFRFIKNTDKRLGGYAVAEYLKKDDRTVTDVEIPAEYNGLPVTSILSNGFLNAISIRRVSIPESVRFIAGLAFPNAISIKRISIPGSVRFIGSSAFHHCWELEAIELSEGIETIGSNVFAFTALKSVKLPKSLKKLGGGAFQFCRELESVEFGGMPSEFGSMVFHGSNKLPLETLVMGLVRSTDITSPIHKADFREMTDKYIGEDCDYFRPDVFELLAKNKCFRSCNVKYLFEKMIREDMTEFFPIADAYGMISNIKLIDMLISYGIEHGKTEITAYLLDFKNRKFGFDGGNGYDLQ